MSAPAAAEAHQLAQSLARSCGFAVFPCGWETKMPTRPLADGGHGYKDGTTDREQISFLWKHWPGCLIGVATGEMSGVSVLDIDFKSDAARSWWRQNEYRLPATRTYRTRSGGLHLVYRHASGVRVKAGVPVAGVDSRGQGGYFIFWYAAGFECLDHSPSAPWPAWLSEFFWPRPKPQPAIKTSSAPLSDDELEKLKARAINLVSRATEGNRHDARRAAGRLLGGIQSRAGFSDDEAVRWIIAALPPSDFTKKEEQAIRYGLEKGRAEPIRTGARQ